MLMTGLIALFALFLGLSIGSCCGYGLGYSERAKRGKEMWKFFHAGRQSGLAEEPQELVVYHYHQHSGLIKEEKTIESRHTRLSLGQQDQRWQLAEAQKNAQDAEHTEEELKQAALKMLDDGEMAGLPTIEEAKAAFAKENMKDALCQGAAEYQAANPSKVFTEAALKILEDSRDERLMLPTADELARHEAEHGTPGWSTPGERGAGLLRNGVPSKT